MVTKWGKSNCLECNDLFDKDFKWSKFCSIQCRTAYNYNKRVLKGRRSEIVGKFGITADDYAEMLNEQDGVCAICKRPETALSSNRLNVKQLAVDHCHSTGKVRGLLCMRCNKGIGFLQDNTIILNNAIDYLENSRL